MHIQKESIVILDHEKPFVKAEKVDNTPIPDESPVNRGGADVEFVYSKEERKKFGITDEDHTGFIFKCKTFESAKESLKAFLKMYRINIDFEKDFIKVKEVN